MKIYLSVLFCFFSAFVLPGTLAFARLATSGDLPYIIEKDHLSYEIKKDGRSTMRRLVIVRINNDRGRESQSVQSLTFNSRAQKFKVLGAATINGSGKDMVRTPVDSDNIEIKEVGEMSQAFDSIKQVSLSYPKVKIGSRLELEYEIKNEEVAFENFWSMAMGFGADFVEDFKLTVNSERELFSFVNDPGKKLTVKNEKKNGKFSLEIAPSGPIVTVTTQEEMSYMIPDRVLGFWISTQPDWQHYASALIPVHEKLLSAKLPPVLQEIANEAKTKATDLEKIETVAAKVAQEFRYFGDWRRRNGGYIPRTLNEIAESRYGDCKDLSLTVAAIYRSLGMNAYMAWVWRGEIAPSKYAYKLPVDTLFNHAVARVDVNGKEYWVDATNPVSYARSPWPDIAGRPAFLVDPKNPRLVETPLLKSDSAIYSSKIKYQLKKDETLSVNAELSLLDRAAISLTAQAFYEPVENVNYAIVRGLVGNAKATSPVVGDFPRGSRIVSNIKIPVSYGVSDLGLRTSAGLGFPLLRDDSVGRLLTEIKDRASDLYISTPWKSVSETEISGVKKVGAHSLDCDLKNDYVHLVRSVKSGKNGVKILDSVEVYKPALPVEYLNSKEFDKFQDRLRSCFNRAAVIVEKI